MVIRILQRHMVKDAASFKGQLWQPGRRKEEEVRGSLRKYFRSAVGEIHSCQVHGFSMPPALSSHLACKVPS